MMRLGVNMSQPTTLEQDQVNIVRNANDEFGLLMAEGAKGMTKESPNGDGELIWTGIAWVPVGDVLDAYAKSLGTKQ